MWCITLPILEMDSCTINSIHIYKKKKKLHTKLKKKKKNYNIQPSVKRFKPQFLYGHAECAQTRRLIGRIFETHFQFWFMAEFVFPYITIRQPKNRNVCHPRVTWGRAQCWRPLPQKRVTGRYMYSRGFIYTCKEPDFYFCLVCAFLLGKKKLTSSSIDVTSLQNSFSTTEWGTSCTK